MRLVEVDRGKVRLAFSYDAALITALKAYAEQVGIGLRWDKEDRAWKAPVSPRVIEQLEEFLERHGFVCRPSYMSVRAEYERAQVSRQGLSEGIRSEIEAVYKRRGFTMRKYQMTAAVAAMERVAKHGLSGLFLDVGLGKTVLSLSLGKVLVERLLISEIVVIAPLSLLNDWRNEAHICGVPVTVMSYSEAVKKRPAKLPDNALVICDEANYIKERTTERGKWVRPSLGSAKAALFLTATPMPTSQAWEVWYLVPYAQSRKEVAVALGARWWYEEIRVRGGEKRKVLRVGLPSPEKIAEYAVCMTQEEVGSELPPLIEEILVLDVDGAELEKEAVVQARREENQEEGKEERKVNLFRLLRILEEKISLYIHADMEVFRNPYLVFYKHRRAGELMEAADNGAVRLGGDTDAGLRAEAVDMFQKGKLRGLLLQHQVGKFGLNLQRARAVIFTMLPWTWDEYWQMVGRARREGQEGTVIGHRVPTPLLDRMWELLQGRKGAHDMMEELARQVSATYKVNCEIKEEKWA